MARNGVNEESIFGITSSLKPIAIAAAMVLGSSALAQQNTPAFEPFSISQDDYAKLSGYLAEQPLKFSEPVMNWLRGKEQEAVMAKQKAAHEPKEGDQK